MKIRILIDICLFCCLLFICGGCEILSEEEKLARSAMHRTLLTLEKRYQMKFIGWSEGGDELHYHSVGLNFDIFRILTKNEGRKMLIDSVEELLKEVNSIPQLRQYLKPSPFTPANIKLTIYDYQPDGQSAYYPNILIFAVYDGKLHYKTKVPEKEFGYYTKEEETYDEALRIVRSQENSNK